MRAAALQVKTALHGTWFADSIVIPADGSAPSFTPDDDLVNTVMIDSSQQVSFQLFPRVIQDSSALFIECAIDRLCPGTGSNASQISRIDDWDLVHDFETAVITRFTAAVGPEGERIIRPFHFGLTSISAYHLTRLVNLPDHRVWPPLVGHSIALYAAFGEFDRGRAMRRYPLDSVVTLHVLPALVFVDVKLS